MRVREFLPELRNSKINEKKFHYMKQWPFVVEHAAASFATYSKKKK